METTACEKKGHSKTTRKRILLEKRLNRVKTTISELEKRHSKALPRYHSKRDELEERLRKLKSTCLHHEVLGHLGAYSPLPNGKICPECGEEGRT